MARRTTALVVACTARLVASQAPGSGFQDVPDVQLFQGREGAPANCQGSPDWNTQGSKLAAGFCDSTPFKDSSGDYTFGESRCTGVDQVNFSLYNKPAGESVLNDCNASTYFNSWALTVGVCQMVAAPCNSPTGPGGPCKQQPLGTVGNDPQFPFGAWMTVKKPIKASERTCRKLNEGLGLYFNDKCSGYPQYSLPQPASAASTAGSCLQTHLGDSSQQQVVAKLTCGSPGKTSLELYACGSGAACSCSTGKPFISLQNLEGSQCAQVATANRSRPDYNPAFPQGAWMQPYRGTCVPPPTNLDHGLSAWAWFGIILLIILFIVVVGVVGLMLIRKQALKADVMTQGSSIYSDNGAGF